MPPKPLTLFGLVQSTTYPPLPTIEELEQLSNTLKAQRTAAKARLANMAPPEEERPTLKKQKRKDREQTDERERAALAANQRAGAALEVVERRRVDTSADIKVKHERGEFSGGGTRSPLRPGMRRHGREGRQEAFATRTRER